MSNIAALLKAEIARVARKETRGEIQALKKAVAHYRSDIAALKRRAASLEQQVKRLSKGAAKRQEPNDEDEGPQVRFSAKGFASQRRRLGLSAEECGALIGASALSVYNWEKGKVRPRDAHLPAIAALRKIGKKEATARLQALKS